MFGRRIGLRGIEAPFVYLWFPGFKFVRWKLCFAGLRG